jgi:branched-chain amino acid transport system ATP-binding protein
MLKVEDIHTYYGSSYVLQGINLEVLPQSIAAILGRNGMGKTTFMHSLMGFVKPRKGKIIYNGDDLIALESFRIARKGLSLVPQGRQIFPSLTVEENLKVASLGGSGKWNIAKVYELFPPLKMRSQHMASKLSGGEQQMLAVARSLMTNPSLLLMDEPTEGLSPIYVQTVGKIIHELHSQGISILFVEQNVRFALKNSTSIYVIHKGRFVYSGTPNDLESNRDIRQNYLGI